MHMDMNIDMDVNRRDALAFGVGMATSALALSFGLPAHATPGEVNGRLAELADGEAEGLAGDGPSRGAESVPSSPTERSVPGRLVRGLQAADARLRGINRGR